MLHMVVICAIDFLLCLSCVDELRVINDSAYFFSSSFVVIINLYIAVNNKNIYC